MILGGGGGGGDKKQQPVIYRGNVGRDMWGENLKKKGENLPHVTTESVQMVSRDISGGAPLDLAGSVDEGVPNGEAATT